MLFRADGLGELTEADLAVLRELGIRTVIDLRSGERAGARAASTSTRTRWRSTTSPSSSELPDAEDFDRRPGLARHPVPRDARRRRRPDPSPPSRSWPRPTPCPAVFHCTAGKDRTGVLSAIVLSLLGVDEPTVVADYALSGEAMVRLRAKLIVKYPEGRDTLENIDEVFSAEPAQMEQLLDHLRRALRVGRRLRGGARGGGRRGRGPAGGLARAARRRSSSSSSLAGCRGAGGRWRRPAPGRAG